MLFVTSALYSGSDSVLLSLSDVESPELEPAALLFCKFGLLLCQFETLDENATWKLGDGLGVVCGRVSFIHAFAELSPYVRQN